MRHRLMRFGPVAVLALTLQLLVPVMALAPLAAAPFDPVFHAELCIAPAGDAGSSDRDVRHGVCCVFCAPLAGGPGLFGPPPAVAGPAAARRVLAVLWPADRLSLPPRLLDLNASARAPPLA